MLKKIKDFIKKIDFKKLFVWLAILLICITFWSCCVVSCKTKNTKADTFNFDDQRYCFNDIYNFNIFVTSDHLYRYCITLQQDESFVFSYYNNGYCYDYNSLSGSSTLLLYDYELDSFVELPFSDVYYSSFSNDYTYILYKQFIVDISDIEHVTVLCNYLSGSYNIIGSICYTFDLSSLDFISYYDCRYNYDEISLTNFESYIYCINNIEHTYEKGYSDARVKYEHQVSFMDLVKGCLYAVFNTFYSILSFDILGVNVFGLFCGIITTCIIIFIISKFV